MPDPQEILADPKFYGLSDAGRVEVLKRADPKFAGLSADAQHAIVVQGEVRHAARQAQVDPDFASAIAHAENGYKRAGTSPKGARGTMQVMPDTAAGVVKSGVPLPQGVDQNIAIGTTYLGQMLKRYGGNRELAAAAYNAGPQRVDAAIKAAGGHTDWAAVAPHLPPETQNYHGVVFGVIHGGRGAPEPAGGVGPAFSPTEGGGDATEPVPGAAQPTGPTEAPEAGSGALDAMAAGVEDFGKRAVQAVAYNGLVFPAVSLQRLGYSFGYPGAKPPADYVKDLQNTPIGQFVGPENLANLDTSTPHGFWAHLSAAAGVLEPTYAPTFGSYVAARAFGADEAHARGIEALVGLAAFGENVARLAAGAKAKSLIANHKAPLQDALEQAQGKAVAATEQAGAAQRAISNPPTTIIFSPRTFGEKLFRGGKGIVPRGAARLRKLVGDAYQTEADAVQAVPGGIALPSTSPQHKAIEDTMQEIERLLQPDVASPAERALMQQIHDEFNPITSSPTQAGPRLGRVGTPVDYLKLRGLHSKMSQVALDPREFPVLRSSQADLLFSKLHAQVNDALETLAVGHPEVSRAAAEAKTLAERQFRFRETAEQITKAKTPEAAASVLFSNTSNLLRIMQESTPTEIEAIQKAGLSRIWRTGAEGVDLDFGAALKQWNKTDPEMRRLLSAIGQDPAQATLFRMLGSKRPNLSAKPLLAAEDAQGAAIRSSAEAQKLAEKATLTESKVREAVLQFQRLGGKVHTQSGFMSRRAGITLAMALGGGVLGATGSVAKSAIASGAYLYLVMHFPKLVAAAIKQPANTAAGVAMIRSIAGILNGYYGLPGNRPAGTAPAAPQSPPAPPSQTQTVAGP